MDQVQRVAVRFMEQLGTPRALTVAILARYGEVGQMQRLTLDPRQYDCAEAFRKDAQATAFLKKVPFPGDDTAREVAAVNDFLACEKVNAATNARLERYVDSQGPFEPCDFPVIAFVEQWRKEFQSVLGPLPSDLTPTFSGGATVGDPSIRCTAPDKLTSRPQFYPKSAFLMSHLGETGWGRSWFARFGGYNWEPAISRGNVFFTVPKNGVTHRGCCKEASAALSYQLPTGKVIRSRIKRAYGYDIRHSKPDHMRLAMLGSIAGVLCTLDLKSASNSLVYNLVKLLASPSWFAWLDALRAPFTFIDGRWQRLEMFSSMGNGFTFELETLVFWSLARTVCKSIGSDPDTVRCFGDDLIAPNEAARPIMMALRFAGFTTNESKSFSDGWFRESCGGDYFRGVDVRPYSLEVFPTEPQHWISLHNGLQRQAPKEAAAVLPLIRGMVPRAIQQLSGPAWCGDVVFASDTWTEKLRPVKVSPTSEPTWVPMVKGYVPVTRVLSWTHWWPSVQLASALIGQSSVGVTPRDVDGYQVRWVPAVRQNHWLPA